MKYTLLAVAAAFFIIAVYESFAFGMAGSYWLFMLSTFTFFLTRLLYGKAKSDEEPKTK